MADPNALVGTLLAHRYRLGEARSGGSGSSLVFDATDVRDDRRVVVRMSSSASLVDLDAGITTGGDALDAFRKHTQGLAGLSHASLAPINDWGVEDIAGTQYAFTVLEYFSGGSLRELLDRGRRLTPSQALVIALDVCRALHFLHGNGLVHGDVRPANLFLGDDNRVRLAGLGIKRAVKVESMSNEQASYAAPEVAVGGEPSERSDVYSLATTLLELITGVVPFVGETAGITLAMRVGKLLPVSAELGPIAPLLERAGRPESDERFSALEFGQALASIAGRMPLPEPIESLAAVSFEDVIEQREAERTADLLRPEIPVELDETQQMPTGGSDTTGGIAGLVITDSNEPIVVATPSEVRRHKRLWIAASIAVALILGFVGFRLLVKPTHVVPDVVGMLESEARNVVSPFDWQVVVRAERSDSAPAGTVLATDPAVGQSLREGATLVLIVSEGETLAQLPDVSGMDAAEAALLLESRGLVVTQTEAESEEIEAGAAISWVVPQQTGLKPGDEVLKGTEVQLLVSTGPALREVPSIIGLTLDQAKEVLDPLRLDLLETPPSYSNAAAEGLIGAQSPPPGEKVARDSGIAFSISLGPDLVELPNIIGNNYSIVESRLNEAGFIIGNVTGRKQNRLQKALIVGQEVANGDLVIRGSTVDLVFP
jgi:beta-lactam-binding protein with PASTA domain